MIQYAIKLWRWLQKMYDGRYMQNGKMVWPFRPDYTVPPCWTINDYLQELPRPDLFPGVYDGREPITKDVAHTLFEITGVPESFWVNLQRNYDESRKTIKAQSYR